MSWATTRDAIAAVLGAVPGITGSAGKVLTYKPMIERPDAWKAALKGTTRVNAWTITRPAGTLRETGTGRRFVPGHEVEIEGWYAVGGDGSVTEPEFQAMVDAVLAAITTSTTIRVRGLESEPVTVRAVPINHQKLAEVLCHHVLIQFPVQDTATVV